ncbi:2-hydroxyacyl-CoA dehydratase subunit D [Oscillibacter ruminantium]|uniref:2-hydroxyacyl-CoA dehydratase subunit D n=1 Tax=Oscillibacter ruminantium TaxID=1263547 RepID=UPI0002FDE0DA|nr:2-hydroxyacyl-CoA dehydratase family protein [Oscillibacter ruminantium]MDN0031551.1 2-hydroxyacyl-CoA dehydratase family protein [Oscillibacter valericigenes]MEA5041310.1 2-hydroxyacyl-CoA dehydratase family protein [Oscillibacter ruminantium]
MSETITAQSNTAPADQAAPAPKPKRPKPKSMLMLDEQTRDLFENARLAKERGEKVGWSASIFPQEIAETLGLNILYPENHSAGIAARHQADPFLQDCEGPLGYSNDLCAYAKVNLSYAAALNGESTVEFPDGGKMVKPDFLLLTNNICNQLTKWYENLAKQMDIPIFFIDTCYNPNDYVTETRVRYVRAQIDQLIQDLCAFTGKTWDEKRFQEVMKISQRNSFLWERANNLMEHKPAPIGGFELFNYMSAMVCNRGKTSSTAVLEQLNAEIEEHIKNGTSTFPVEEQFRVSWDGIACWPYLSHNLRTMKKYGINMVASSYGKAWAIEYDDLDGMARAYCFASTNGDNASTMIDRRMEALKKFDCEGTIYHVNRSCKVMDCQMMEVQRQISERAGIPFASFDGDQADYRNYSEAQFETRIQGLVEVMAQKKEANANG